MKEKIEFKREMDKIYRKLGSNGTIVSSILLASSILEKESTSPIMIGILSVSLITSHMLLTRKQIGRVIKSIKEDSKVKKLG